MRSVASIVASQSVRGAFFCPLLLLLAAAAPAQDLLVNPGAETGTIIGWTPDTSGASTGNAGIIAAVTEQVQTEPTVYPYEGDWFFSFAADQTSTGEGSGETVSLYQTGYVPAGADSLALSGWFQTELGDPGEAALSFRSSSGDLLGLVSTGQMTSDAGWTQFALVSAVPTGAATWRVELFGSVAAGTYVNVFWDALNLVEIAEQLDFGDAPDDVTAVLYPTLLGHDGARHVIGGPWLGDAADAPDAEEDGQPGPDALGDDNNGGDDENGVVIPELVKGEDAVITLQVSGQAGWVDAWIDFNRDDFWSQSAETVFSGMLAPGFHQFTVPVPVTAETGTSYARFRINSEGPLTPSGPAADGEVEDYAVQITAKWSAAPDLTPDAVYISCTWRYVADDFECTRPGPVTGIRFWGAWRPNSSLPPDSIRVYSDLPADLSPTGYAMPDSLLWACPVAPEDFVGVVESDFVDRTWIVPGHHVYPGMQVLRAEYFIPVPREQAFVQLGTPEEPRTYWLVIRYENSMSSFGWNSSLVGGGSPAVWDEAGVWYQLFYPDGHVMAGEPIDLAFELVTDPGDPWDFGDAPFDLTLGGYPTTLAQGGAYHVIGGPWLGDAADGPDSELDGQPDALAQGDDDAGTDDENGVVFPIMNVALVETLTVEINGGGGFLQGWIDFDQDRIWETEEMMVAAAYPDGVHAIEVPVPTHASEGETFARFRISSAGDLQPDGRAEDGEVEDYRIVIDPGPSAAPDASLPRAFRLHACAPNPFNPETWIRFDLPRDAAVRLEVYDVAGRRVRTLLDGERLEAGRRQAVWRGRDDAGRELSAGVYFCRLQAGGFRETKKAVLVK